MTDRGEPQRKPGVDVSLTRHGGLSYLELPATDAALSASFYERVLGWRVDRSDSARIKFSDRLGHLIGRWCTGRPASPQHGLALYFYVENVHEASDAARRAGGVVVREPYAEGDLLVATVRDPAGNLIGLWQAMQR